MIDPSPNYGKKIKGRFLQESKPYASVLDIGAGRGVDLLMARTVELRSRLYAIECYGPNIDYLRSIGIETSSIDIEREAMPVPDESFDVIISNQVFEHLKEVFWVLHEASRVLKPGGNLI